jgi:hypothetical protein
MSTDRYNQTKLAIEQTVEDTFKKYGVLTPPPSAKLIEYKDTTTGKTLTLPYDKLVYTIYQLANKGRIDDKRIVPYYMLTETIWKNFTLQLDKNCFGDIFLSDSSPLTFNGEEVSSLELLCQNILTNIVNCSYNFLIYELTTHDGEHANQLLVEKSANKIIIHHFEPHGAQGMYMETTAMNLRQIEETMNKILETITNTNHKLYEEIPNSFISDIDQNGYDKAYKTLRSNYQKMTIYNNEDRDRSVEVIQLLRPESPLTKGEKLSILYEDLNSLIVSNDMTFNITHEHATCPRVGPGYQGPEDKIGFCVGFSMLWTYIVVSVLNKLNRITDYIPYDDWVSYVNHIVLPDPSDPSRRQLLYSVVVNFIADLFGKTIDYNENIVKYLFTNSTNYSGCYLLSNMFGPDNLKFLSVPVPGSKIGPNIKKMPVAKKQNQAQDINGDFLEVIIPLLLEEIPNYYITGDRAYDYYFVEKLGSIDYDIIISKSSYKTLYTKLLKYAEAKGYTLNNPQGAVRSLFFTENGKPVMFGDEKVFMICAIQEQRILESAYIVCNDLNYVTFETLVKNIFTDEKVSARLNKEVEEALETLTSTYRALNDYERDEDENEREDFEFHRVSYDAEDLLESLKYKLTTMQPDRKKLYYELKQAEEYYNQKLMRKDERINKQKDQVTYISWDSLSNDYKKCILSNKLIVEQKLFDYGPYCSAYIESKNGTYSILGETSCYNLYR